MPRRRFALKLLILTLTLAGCRPEEPQTSPSPAASEVATSPPPESVTQSEAGPVPAGLRDQDKVLWLEAAGFFRVLPKQPTSPKENPTTAAKIQLGKLLFHEPRLSKSGALSCNSCHNLASYGVDNRSTSLGHGFKPGERNSPTVLNASLHLSQFWDGRAADLETQAQAPILNPAEMAMGGEADVLKRLQSIPEYRQAFDAAFPDGKDGINYSNVARAIAAFERTLLTPSPFDKFLLGDSKALKPEQKIGLQTFISQGCVSCHSGAGIGGGMYQKFGMLKPYQHQKDTGRHQITKQDNDKFFFKVPSLRNVARTYPYFHDGQIWNLDEAVKIMGQTQLGKELSAQEISQLVAFLESLTGDIPKDALTLPVLPASRPDTPKPEI